MHMFIAIGIFILVYIAISMDIINRATAALFGAAVLLVLKVIPLEIAFANINLNIILLLISMMIIVNVIRDTGMFQYLAIRTAKLAKGDPLRLIVFVMGITALLSAFLDNVTTILVLSPLSILIAVELGISPIPFLVTQAIASNIGGTATLIGDPPNIMIGYSAGLTFNSFITNLSPLILLILVTSMAMTALIFRKSLVVSNERRARIMEFDESESISDRPFLYKSLAVFGLVIAGLMLHDVTGIGPTPVALFGATLLLILNGSKTEEYFAEIEWVTIFFFIGLFILVGSLEETGVIALLGKKLVAVAGNNLTIATMSILWGSGLASGVIDNIPFVATMIPLIKILNASYNGGAGNVLWWALSVGACLGGNFTLIGAAANVVAAGIATKNGFHISFWDFTRYGILYALMSLVVSSVWFFLVYL